MYNLKCGRVVPSVIKNDPLNTHYVSREFGQRRQKGPMWKSHSQLQVFCFSCMSSVFTSSEENTSPSLLTGSRGIVCFLWPAVVFCISQLVSLTLHLPLFLVLGQSSLAFSPCKAAELNGSWEKKKEKKKTVFLGNIFENYFLAGNKKHCLWRWRKNRWW